MFIDADVQAYTVMGPKRKQTTLLAIRTTCLQFCAPAMQEILALKA